MTRSILVSLLAAAILPLSGTVARGDSWMAPPQQLVPAPDGRTYLILDPTPVTEASFVLCERRAGAPPRKAVRLAAGASGGPLGPDPGDRVLARGRCPVPMEVYCLDRGEGFVLFETYAQLGHGPVAVRYDGNGEPAWSVRLSDLFSPEEIGGFRNSVSSIWWYETVRFDPKRGELVVVYEQPRVVPPDAETRGPNLGPRRGSGVLRIALADGAHVFGKPADLLEQVGHGTPEQQRKVLDAVARAQPPGWQAALRKVLADEGGALLSRIAAAVHLQTAGGDARGRDLVRQAAASDEPPEVRALALEHLAAFDGDDAIPALRAALRAEPEPAVSLAIYRALAARGASALPSLGEMVGERDAPSGYRCVAAQLLAALGGAARDALPALLRAAQDPDQTVAEQARHAAEVIRRAQVPR